MCERRSDSTTLPDDPGPSDDSFGYRVTEEGFKALAEYEKLHGKTVVRKVPLSDEVAEVIATEEWLDDRRQRRRKARKEGRRLVTVCGKWRGGRKIPEIRLMGLWLESAEFTLGRLCEVEVGPGKLTIRTV